MVRKMKVDNYPIMCKLIGICVVFCMILLAVRAQLTSVNDTQRIKELETELKSCREDKVRANQYRNRNTQNRESNTTLVPQRKRRHGKDGRIRFLQASLEAEKNKTAELWEYVASLESHITQTNSSAEEILKMALKDCINLSNSSDYSAEQGWTIIQRRFDGSVDFYRSWNDYRAGFGDINGEFFIGLEKLHNLTASMRHELHIQLEDFENETRYAGYSDFRVGNAVELYNLKSLGNYTGDAGDALIYNLNQNFSTFDMDNDFDDENCAEDMHGAWWYKACGASNLNGMYIKDSTQVDAYDLSRGVGWDSESWHEFDYSYKSVTMKIRPRTAN